MDQRMKRPCLEPIQGYLGLSAAEVASGDGGEVPRHISTAVYYEIQ